MRQALARDEFELRYEPIVALATGSGEAEVAGFKAAVYWRHPLHGLLESADFLPAVREAPTLVEIDRWALRTGSRMLAAWRDGRPHGAPLSVGVEISAKQFTLDDFADFVCELAREYALTPGTLHLEIAEAALVERAAQTPRSFARLRDCGARLHIRAFGMGQSVLAQLLRLPVSALKIDRSFVTTMLDDAESAAMVRAIVALAHGLHVRTIAEGVSSAAQTKLLREFGCDYAQGPLFGEALATGTASNLHETRPL